jgi:hypothetical protein
MVVRNVLCDEDESINHLFFQCHFARLVWRVVHFTFNTAPPTNCTNMLENWLNGIDKDTNAGIQVGTCAIVWSLWNCGNDIIIKKKGNAHFFYRLPAWLCIGSTSCLTYYRRKRMVLIWFLRVPVWRRLHGISSIRLVGSLLDDYMMLRDLICLFFSG